MENIIPVVLGGSWASGINLYMTAAGLGVADRMGWLNLPGSLDVLSNPLIIALAVALYGVEFFADKIPFFDSVWDMIHTFIRPAGGAMLGYLAASEAGPIIQAGTAMLTGSVALGSHLSKSTTRAAVNTTLPIPFLGAAVSVAEDSAVFSVLYFIVKHPVIATFLALAFIMLSVWLIIKFFRFLKRLFNPVKKEEVVVQHA